MSRRLIITIAVLLSIWPVRVWAQPGPYDVRILVDDGGWTWFNDERCIVDGNSLIIGSVDSQGYSRADVVPMDVSGDKTVARPYKLSTWTSRDDHNNPALLMLSNGKLLAAYAKHHQEPRWYWRTAAMHHDPNGMQLIWGPQQSMTLPARDTYNNLFQLTRENNRIYNFVRCVGFNPNVMVSRDQAQTWSAPIVLIQSGDSSTRPYVKYFSNGRDRIDFLYTDGHPRREPANSVYHLYYRDGAFHRSDGTVVRTWDQLQTQPLVPSDGTKIYDGSGDTGRGWVWDFEYDPEGHPVAVYINAADHAEGNDLRYRYARWDAAAKRWSEQQIAFAGTHLYVPENHYAGGISIDPADVNTVYISGDVDPVTGRALPSGHYQIFRGKTPDRGKTWQWTQLTYDKDQDNLRPIVPRHHGCRICTIWLQGRYTTYTDFHTHIVGIIEK